MGRGLSVLLLCLLASGASAQNLVVGGHFDTVADLDAWDYISPFNAWSEDDALGSPLSGSLEFEHVFTPVGRGYIIVQCVSVLEGESYAFGFHGKMRSSALSAGNLGMRVAFRSGEECGGDRLFSDFPVLETTTTDTWQALGGSGVAPEGATTAEIELRITKTEGDEEDRLKGFFDEVFLEPMCSRDRDCDDGVFCNGYERCDEGVCVAGPTCESMDSTLECIEERDACVVRWNVDFQGDRNHSGFFGQDDPVDHSEPGVFWNIFEVPALDSSTSSDSEIDPASKFASTGADALEAQLYFEGELLGWAGWPGGHSLYGDYLILFDAAGVNSRHVDWKLVVPKDTLYDLTFMSHDDNNSGRWITFEVDGAGSATQPNDVRELTLRTLSTPDGSILGSATGRSGGEGNWAGLEVATVPKRRFLVDFQGDEDHGGLYGQTDPIPQAETEVWNHFDVQAFNSTTASDYQTDPGLDLVDDLGGDLGVRLEIVGDVMGWAGWNGADPLIGDYLLLVDAFGVDTNEIDWQISGLEARQLYRLTFRTHDNGATNRALLFQTGGQSLTVRNSDLWASVDVVANAAGVIAGTATNAGSFEGDWSALEIAYVPEPASAPLALAATATLCALARRRRASAS